MTKTSNNKIAYMITQNPLIEFYVYIKKLHGTNGTSKRVPKQYYYYINRRT